MSDIRLALLIVVLIFLIFLLLLSLINSLLPVPFIPTSKKLTKKMIDAADLTKNDIVYDLGSGDGRIVLEAAKKSKEAVGFEINPVLTVLSKTKARFYKINNATFITKSVYRADLSHCDKLFLYLSPKLMKGLERKILEEMKEGAYIVSHAFSFPNMEPIKVVDNKIKIYKVKKDTMSS
jgi:precorrin-6B methylase 2